MTPARKNPESLSSVVKIGAVVFVVCLGLWGCARKPAAHVGDTSALESKVIKLEQDLRTANSVRDKARKDLAVFQLEAARQQEEANAKAVLAQETIKASQAERDELHKMLVARTTDRDDLRQQLVQRIQERDGLSVRVEKFRKGMLQLIAQDDAPPVTAPTSPGSPGTPGTPPIPAVLNTPF